MFRCTNCEQIDNFSLMLSANYAGPGVFTQTLNEHGEIIINIDGYEFIPDLAFMNSHSVCKYCGNINCFEYYFEQVVKEREQEEGQPEKQVKKSEEFPESPDIEVNPPAKKRKKSKKNAPEE